MYKFKYEKYKNKYLNMKFLLNQNGGSDYKCYLLHPTDITSLNDAFGNQLLKIKINLINEKLIKPNINIINKFKQEDNSIQKYKCSIKNIINSNDSNNLNKLLLIIYKLKNKFKNYPNYDSDIYPKLNIIKKNFELNKKKIINYDIYINALNKILDNSVQLAYLDELSITEFSSIKSNKHNETNCVKLIDSIMDEKLIDESPQKKQKIDTISITIKIIHIINKDEIIILLVYNKIDDKEYIDFIIIGPLNKLITINKIYDIIINNKSEISKLCINKLIPLNVIGILKNN